MKKSAYRSASAPVKRYQYLRDITTHVALGSVFFQFAGLRCVLYIHCLQI